MTRSPIVRAALVLGFTTAGIASAAAQAGVIDPDYASVEERMHKEQTSKCGNLNVIRRVQCSSGVRQEYAQRGLLRGTAEYITKNYGSFAARQLDEQIRERNKVFRQVRNLSTLDERRPGEVTYSDMSIEVSELARLIRSKGGRPPEVQYR